MVDMGYTNAGTGEAPGQVEQKVLQTSCGMPRNMKATCMTPTK